MVLKLPAGQLRGKIENNTGAYMHFPEKGAHLDFMQFVGNSSDLVIRGNLSLPGNVANVQGIFMSDSAVFNNTLIEQNIIITGMIRGISVSTGDNVVARYNTVLDIQGVGSKATLVIVPGEKYKNIQGSYATHSNMGIDEGNLTLQQTDINSAYHYDRVFFNATRGIGIRLQDLAIVPGSLGESYGAYERLNELLQ